MNINLKEFKILKLKKFMKKEELLFFFQSNRLNQKDWKKIEQTLKKLKLKYYKLFNSTTTNTFKTSIYFNYSIIINNFLIILTPVFKTTLFNKLFLTKELKTLFVLLSIKLNNKMYSLNQIKGLNNFSYKSSAFNMFKSLEKYLKMTNVFNTPKNF